MPLSPCCPTLTERAYRRGSGTYAVLIMPVPRPSEETKLEWLDRCIPQVLEDGTADDIEQATAICLQMWHDAQKQKK